MDCLSLFLSVLLLNLFAYITIRIRPFIYKTNVYNPMIWNINLSIMPFVIRTIIFIIGLMVWLLALPNSGYLVTELNLSHWEADQGRLLIYFFPYNLFHDFICLIRHPLVFCGVNKQLGKPSCFLYGERVDTAPYVWL